MRTRSPNPSRRGTRSPTSRSGCPTPNCGWSGPRDWARAFPSPRPTRWPPPPWPWPWCRRLPGSSAGPRRPTPGPRWSRKLGADRVRLGAADPARSATGLLALAGIGASSARQGGDSDTRVAQTAKALAERMSDGDAQVLGTLARSTSGAEEGNPKRNQAVLVSEQAAFAHNAEATGGGELDLFYPRDGAPLLDYPYTLVNEADLSVAESRAALRFMTLLGDRDARAVFAEHGFRAGDGSAEDSLVAAAGGRKPQPYATPAAEAPSAKEPPGDARDVDDHRAERPADHRGRRLGVHGDTGPGAGPVTDGRHQGVVDPGAGAVHPERRDRAVGVRHHAGRRQGLPAAHADEAARRPGRGRRDPPGGAARPPSRGCGRCPVVRRGCTTPRWPRTRKPGRRS
ncbi:hypothetical protein SGRI78S_06515 [Streptomyces griseus subsp. griseus]